MKPTQPLVAGILFAGLAAAPAAAADADDAREAANAFATAMKAKDLDAAMKLVGTPFLLERGKEGGLIDKTEKVKAGLKTVFDRVEPDRVPTAIKRVIPAEQTREAFKGRVKGLDLIEKAAGNAGYLVLMTLPRDQSKLGFVILVAPRDGVMKVVGMVD